MVGEDQQPSADSNDGYADGTPLTWILGEHPKVKIIAALISEPDQDVIVSDLARMAGLSRSAVYDHIEDLIEHGVVKETREVGSSSMYTIANNDVTTALASIQSRLVEQKYDRDSG